MSSAKKQIEKLKKNVEKLEKQIECLEWKRAHLEDIREQGLLFLRTINREIEEARKLISKQNRELKRLNLDLKREKNKSDNLLLNILPKEIAENLKQTGKVIPKMYDSVSVLFTDFSGFTGLAHTMSPEELLKELDYCFSAFDKICGKYHLEKLKTIGDSYMCAGGIPVPNKTHAVDAILAGLEMVEFMKIRHDQKQRSKLPYWNIRIGIHSGNLIAGIIGRKKFAYDIWGDTVNTASRMESGGVLNQVNISKETNDLVSKIFRTKYRGKVEVKNKEKLEMYIVTGFKPGLKNKKNEPNSQFWKEYNRINLK
ncbi:MAG: adenylate/guanylate cyclase domain-containing protein [bacterium]|nr:adenylate/guanylate cyclase domain-containing protein [bacterium]